MYVGHVAVKYKISFLVIKLLTELINSLATKLIIFSINSHEYVYCPWEFLNLQINKNILRKV